MSSAKHCPKCNTVKSSEEFHIDKHRADGLSSQCRQCRNEKRKQSRGLRPSEASRTGIQLPSRSPEYRKEYQKLNAPRFALHRAARRSAEKSATPSWANRKAMLEVYALAKEFRESGIDVDVDHIIPLRGKNVCGLHVENNLRVCLKKNNQRKKNSVDDHITLVIIEPETHGK